MIAMVWPTPYDTGTVSIAPGATVAVGTGTFWSPLAAQANLLFIGTSVAFVDSVTDDTHLAIPAWAGSAVVAQPYKLVQFPVASLQVTKQIRDFLAKTAGIGVFYNVTAAAPDNSIGDDGDYAIKTNTGQWLQWIKVGGVWVLQGTPIGVVNRGAWSGATAYAVNDIVTRLGIVYLSNTSNTNHAPESNPTDWSVLGAKGDTGAAGAPGADGKTFRNGTGAPSNGLGNDGDFYLATDTHFLYGPKASGVWPAGTNIIGPTGGAGPIGTTGNAGADGKTVRYGAGAPANSLGQDSDFYISTDTHFIYGPKVAGTWPAGTSIVGIQGVQGLQGTGIEPDATGTLTQRGAYDNQVQGFKFLQTDVSPFRLWIKASNTTADWAGPTFIGGTAGVGDYGHATESVTETFDYGHAA